MERKLKIICYGGNKNQKVQSLWEKTLRKSLEAVKTNVIGTDNVLTACIESGVKKVICLFGQKKTL